MLAIAVLVIKLLIMPHLPHNYTYQDVVRFNFGSFRETFQIVLFSTSAVLTVFLFSSSAELKRPWSIIEEELGLTYNGTTAVITTGCKSDGFVKTSDYYCIQDKRTQEVRFTLCYLALCCFGVVVLASKLPKDFLQSVNAHLKTSLPRRLAPMYNIWVFGVSCLTMVFVALYAFASCYWSDSITERLRITSHIITPVSKKRERC